MLPRPQVLYGAAAMSVAALVFSYLQEREQEQELGERTVTTAQFRRAMGDLELTVSQRTEMQRFWRSLCKKMKQQQQEQSLGSTEGAEQTKVVLLQRMPSDGVDEDDGQTVNMHEIHKFAHEYQRVFPDLFPEQQLLLATELAATYPKWNGIVESTSSMIMSTSKRFQDIAKDTKGEMQQAVHRTVRNFVERALNIVADRLKNQLKDPHMPEYLKVNIDVLVDKFMPDVKVEIFRKTRDLLSPQQHAKPHNPVVPAHERTEELSWFRKLRAKVLYHLFPYDKSIWMSLRDPWWVFFTCVGIFPVIGQLWWLFLFTIKDKTNEHQLCQFIIGFKVAQFITLGLFYTCFGVLSYVSCIAAGSMVLCHERGPRLEPWNAFFFILQIALVWTAFFRLPYTVRPAESKHALLYRSNSLRTDAAGNTRPRRVYHDVFGNELHLNRGGYLMKFCGYETVSFSIIVLMICAIMWLPFVDWQRKALLFWIRTAYGLFSFPYIAFKIPVLATVLMHTRRMGYNEFGETVRVAKLKQPESDKEKKHL